MKKFSEYIKEYIYDYLAKTECTYEMFHEIRAKLTAGEFDNISFEFRIGLLKFICDDLEMPYDCWQNCYGSYIVENVCPQGFLNTFKNEKSSKKKQAV